MFDPEGGPVSVSNRATVLFATAPESVLKNNRSGIRLANSNRTRRMKVMRALDAYQRRSCSSQLHALC